MSESDIHDESSVGVEVKIKIFGGATACEGHQVGAYAGRVVKSSRQGRLESEQVGGTTLSIAILMSPWASLVSVGFVFSCLLVPDQ
jgi:hypothetical protein